MLVKDLAARGHEVAVHGWDHRCLAAKRRGPCAESCARTVDLLESVTGERPARGIARRTAC